MYIVILFNCKRILLVSIYFNGTFINGCKKHTTTSKNNCTYITVSMFLEMR